MIDKTRLWIAVLFAALAIAGECADPTEKPVLPKCSAGGMYDPGIQLIAVLLPVTIFLWSTTIFRVFL